MSVHEDQDADEDVEEEDDDDDEWNPVCQGAAVEGNDSHEDIADAQDEEDEAVTKQCSCTQHERRQSGIVMSCNDLCFDLCCHGSDALVVIS